MHTPAKKALVIGINEYAPPNALPSCIEDADGIAQLLNTDYGFQSITSLKDGEATKAAILEGVKRLISDASDDDDLVFYYSGHGYTFQQGTDMIEALVPHDLNFLTSDDLSAALQGVPPGSLTVVLDSCFSGGMQKAFVKGGGAKRVQVKFWTPPASHVEKDFSTNQRPILDYKSFGSPPTPIAESAVIGERTYSRKAFSTVSPPPTTGQRQFIMLSACQDDETAAASTDLSDGKSVFTFALLQNIADNGREIGVAALLDETGKDLRKLGIRQTPMLKVPAAPPRLAEHAFLLWDQPIPSTDANAGPGMNKSGPPLTQTLKGNTMGQQQISKDWLSDIESIVRTVTPVIAAALKDYQPPVKGFEASPQSAMNKVWFGELTTTIATIVPAIVAGMKDFNPPTKDVSFATPKPFDKGWFDDLTSIVATLVPVVVGALKSPQIQSKSLSQLSVAAQKGWFDDVTHVVASILPVILAATKDLKPTGALAAKVFQGDEKGFWDTLSSIAQVAVPIALAIL